MARGQVRQISKETRTKSCRTVKYTQFTKDGKTAADTWKFLSIVASICRLMSLIQAIRLEIPQRPLRFNPAPVLWREKVKNRISGNRMEAALTRSSTARLFSVMFSSIKKTGFSGFKYAIHENPEINSIGLPARNKSIFFKLQDVGCLCDVVLAGTGWLSRLSQGVPSDWGAPRN